MEKILKLSKYVDRLAEYMVISFFSVMIFSSILQVFTRFVLNDSLSWTEELARFTFIWANLLGASICVKNNKHARITVIFDNFSSKTKKYVSLLIQSLIITMASVMVVQGFTIMEITKTQLSAALKLQMSLVYLAIPVSGILIIIYSLINIIIVAKSISGKEDNI